MILGQYAFRHNVNVSYDYEIFFHDSQQSCLHCKMGVMPQLMPFIRKWLSGPDMASTPNLAREL